METAIWLLAGGLLAFGLFIVLPIALFVMMFRATSSNRLEHESDDAPPAEFERDDDEAVNTVVARLDALTDRVLDVEDRAFVRELIDLLAEPAAARTADGEEVWFLSGRRLTTSAVVRLRQMGLEAQVRRLAHQTEGVRPPLRVAGAALSDAVREQMFARVDEWAHLVTEEVLTRSHSYGFEQQSVAEETTERWAEIADDCEAIFFHDVDDELKNSLRDEIRRRVIDSGYDVRELEKNALFEGFRFVDRELPPNDEFEVPELAFLVDGPGLIDCSVEAGSGGIDLMAEGICGYRPLSADDADRVLEMAEWVRKNAPWNSAAIENAKSVAPNNVGWFQLDDELILAFEIDRPPREVVEFIDYLRTLEYGRLDG